MKSPNRPFVKHPCPNCPFRCDENSIKLQKGRLTEILSDLDKDDSKDFICHNTLNSVEMNCAGAIAFRHKLGKTSIPARVAVISKNLSEADINENKKIVIEPEDLGLKSFKRD